MNHQEALALTRAQEITEDQARQLLRYVSLASMSDESIVGAREIAIRCLSRVEEFPPSLQAVLQDLLRQLGYYPYVGTFEELPLRIAMSFEFHRSDALPNVVMHSEQFKIAHELLSDQSVILSAPTSFGKSLLIEEIVASGRFDNIAIIQPTLALIDETREKLRKYDERYKIIFSKAQALGRRNLLLLTAERLVEMPELPKVDFFVIDEFYKLSMDRNDDRASVLNHAFYILLKHTRHFYLLGPSITSIPSSFPDEYECKFVRSHFNTVVSDVIRVKCAQKQRFSRLLDLLQSLPEPTLIYCKSPAAAEKYAKEFSSMLGGSHQTLDHDEAIQWISENIHPDWSLSKCLRSRVGYHHGRLPRYIGKYLVNSFNDGTIRYLFCTSTLIEGVNTAAKNVVIYDNSKADKPIDHFDFANIAGRSGRMGRYLIGKVYVFDDTPPVHELDVDFPWYTQRTATPEVLVQLDDNDLKKELGPLLDAYRNHHLLDFETIRRNSHLSPDAQIALAEYLDAHLHEAHRHLMWTAYPNWDELLYTCNLLWAFFVGKDKHRDGGVYSGASLAYVIRRYSRLKAPGPIVKELMSKGLTADKAIQECMEQIRVWCDFKFPKLLSALDSIQRKVFSLHGLTPGNYRFFAANVENGFVHPSLAALSEFGVPPQVAAKLQHYLPDLSDLDKVIEQIRRLNLRAAGLQPFERKLLSHI